MGLIRALIKKNASTGRTEDKYSRKLKGKIKVFYDTYKKSALLESAT